MTILEKSVVYLSALLLLSVASLVHPPRLDAKNLFTYYSPMLACFDEHARQLNLHEGIGLLNYATQLSTYNHSGIQVAQVSPHLTPFHFLNSKRIYGDHDFDFIVIHPIPIDSTTNPIVRQILTDNYTINPIRVIQRFGQPTSTFSCPDNYDFYVYSNHKLNNIFQEDQTT